MKRLLHLALLSLMFAGCCPTRIVTISPYENHNTGYSTTVTVPKTHTVTTTTQVTPMIDDLSLYLDLHAVGAAFAQSSSVKEFEKMLNNSSYMLSNLDLNNDGYVDYLRVLETVQGYNHVFLIQAVLASNIYQDVATLVAELPSHGTPYVEVIGSPYIYGPNYVVRPVFLVTPAIYSCLRPVHYKPWTSPYYWGYFPSYYKRPTPIAISHYYAYVETFVGNHKYCREVTYVQSVHYTNYVNVTINITRNDYGRIHPERSFESRNADIATRFGSAPDLQGESGNRRVYNANDIRQISNASVERTTTSTRNASTSSSSASSRRASESSSSASGRSTSTSSSSAPNRSTSTSSPTETSRRTATPSSADGSAATSNTSIPSRSTSTTTSSRVKNSGSSNTTISTVSPSGSRTTVSRNSSSSTSVRSSSSSSTGSGRRAATSDSSRDTAPSASNPSRGTSSSSPSRR